MISKSSEFASKAMEHLYYNRLTTSVIQYKQHCQEPTVYLQQRAMLYNHYSKNYRRFQMFLFTFIFFLLSFAHSSFSIITACILLQTCVIIWSRLGKASEKDAEGGLLKALHT